MKINFIFLLLVNSILFTSCISKYDFDISQDLPAKNYQFVDLVSVKTKKWSLVFFDMQQKNIALSTKKDLELLFPLKQDENFINLLSEHKTTYVLGIFKKQEVTLTVDKIKYVSDSSVSKYSDKYLEKINFKKDTIENDLFQFGDTVIYKAISFEKGGFNEQSKCIFISYNKEKGKAMLSVVNEKGINEVRKVDINDVFTYKIKNYKNFEINKIIYLRTTKTDFTNIAVCAFSVNYFLIVEKGILIKVKYQNIIQE